jgi:adenylate cyclase
VLALAQRAVGIDDALPLTHMVLGVAYLWQKQYEQAIAEGERATTLGPNYADRYAWLGHILYRAGQLEEALAAAEKALRLNPHDPFFSSFTLGFGTK